MDMQEIFLNRLEQLIQTDSQVNEKTLIVLQGFAKSQVRVILQNDHAVLGENLIDANTGYLKMEEVHRQGKVMAEQIAKAQSGVFVVIYEQFLAMRPYLCESVRVLVKKNNLFKGLYPSALSPQVAEKLSAFYHGESLEEKEEYLLDYYGNAVVKGNIAFVSFINGHAERAESTEPFYLQSTFRTKKLNRKSAERMALLDRDFLLRKVQVQEGDFSEPCVYTADSASELQNPEIEAFVSLMKEAKIPYGIEICNRFDEINVQEADKLLPVLQKYWGENARFRSLQFYRNPDENNEILEISQGNIITQLTEQSEAALSKEKEFRNMFITAPTGAGKSILFQIPAIYLAERYAAVTIVVTPLKALMKDQVAQLESEHGVLCATCLNSDISYEERQERIMQIHNGEKSIVYLSPELLISCDVKEFIGNRRIGLFVVDEAHTVTSWGKDFRADYWYLGEYLQQLHQSGYQFPVLCLTATAVYGGEEDVVNETIRSLGVERPIIYLGRVRRDNIEFDIAQMENSKNEQAKIQRAAETVADLVNKHEKTIMYFPYTTQVDNVYSRLLPQIRRRVRKYHSHLQALERNLSQLAFQKNDCDVMLCTKAFGMGVDISDIQNVYHYAPTGNLADYVQEIGRAARRPEIHGRAITDYMASDLQYMTTLFELSELKPFQLREILRKIHEEVLLKNSRQIKVSPNAFSYLFQGDEDMVENKVKNGLLLLSKDLENRYEFPLIRLCADTEDCVNYVNVPEEAERKFKEKYGEYAQLQPDDTRLVISSKNRFFASDTIVRNSGRIYRIDMRHLWENCFQSITYAQFHRKFFNGELFNCGGDQPLSPRTYVYVRFFDTFDACVEKFQKTIAAISSIFRTYKLQKKSFTADEFKEQLQEALGEDFTRVEFSQLILNRFVTTVPQRMGAMGSDRSHMIAFKKGEQGAPGIYRVLNNNYLTLEKYYLHLMSQAVPNQSNIYRAFIPVGHAGKHPAIVNLFAMLELLGLAGYSMQGSRSKEIPIYVADPKRLADLAKDSSYENKDLIDIHCRHQLAAKTMGKFLGTPLSSEERWQEIERYFLGKSCLNSHNQ